MTSISKKLTSIIFILILIYSVNIGAFAAPNESDTELHKTVTAETSNSKYFDKFLENPDKYEGVIPMPISPGKSQNVITLADSYPRKYSTLTDSNKNSNSFPSIRDQFEYNDCWAFSTIAALEFSSVMYNEISYADNSNLFSEHHLAASLNNTNDAGYKKYTFNYNQGGNQTMSLAYLTRQLSNGPVRLNEYTQSDYAQYFSNKKNYTSLLNKSSDMSVEKAIFITDMYEGSSKLYFNIENNTVKNISYSKNYSSINSIKENIIKYGAVTSSYISYENEDSDIYPYYNSQTSSYCMPWDSLINGTAPDNNEIIYYLDESYDYNLPMNHELTIIGWDDDYSYKNFATYPCSYDGEKYNYENGAWLVRNSWGGDWGDGGYEYISYMDPTIGFNATAYSLDSSDDTIYSYDTLGMTTTLNFSGGPFDNDEQYFLNRYTTQDGSVESLNSIGLYIINPGDSIEIYVDDNAESYIEPRNISDHDFTKDGLALIDPETKMVSKEVFFYNAGYYVIDLAEPLIIENKFDVYIKLTPNDSNFASMGACNKDYFETYSSNFEKTDSVSYFAAAWDDTTVSEWEDTADSIDFESNWCIKAYTSDNVGFSKPSDNNNNSSNSGAKKNDSVSFDEINIDDEQKFIDFKISLTDDIAKNSSILVVLYDDSDNMVDTIIITPFYDKNNEFKSDSIYYGDATNSKYCKILVWDMVNLAPHLQNPIQREI